MSYEYTVALNAQYKTPSANAVAGVLPEGMEANGVQVLVSVLPSSSSARSSVLPSTTFIAYSVPPSMQKVVSVYFGFSSAVRAVTSVTSSSRKPKRESE